MTEQQKLRADKNRERNLKGGRILLLLACSCHFIGCGLIMLVFVVHEAKTHAVFWPANLTAGLIWGMNLLGYVFLLFANDKRKKLPHGTRKRPIGLIAFFKTIPGAIADVVFILCAAVFVVCVLLLKMNQGYLALTTIALGLFSLQMHGYFNGRNFRQFFR